MGYLMYYSAFILWFDHFLDSGAEICQIFRWFFGKLKKKKKSRRHSEIIWPLKGWRDFKDRTGHYNAILNRENKRVGCSATKNGKGVCLWCYLTKN